MSLQTLLQGIGLVCVFLVMLYLGGDITGHWEAKAAYSLFLSMIGIAAFFAAERQKKVARVNHGSAGGVER